MKRLAFLLALLCAATARAAAPTEVTAEYKVLVNGLLGARVQESYVRRGDAYAIESRSVSEGLVKLFKDDSLVYTSEGRVGPAGLEPAVFERRQLGDRNRDVRATFDWKNGVMHSSYRGEMREIELPRGTQDRLSLMYQFMNVAPRGDTVEMHMSNGRKVERYTFRLAGAERLKTDAGEFEALHYERVTADPGESRTQLWLARERHNLPLRVIFDDPKGVRLDQTLVQLHTR